MQACKVNPDQWFADDPADIETAKDLCQDCPLSRFNACREEGWSHEFGVFGGMSHLDRKAADPKRYAALVKANDEAAGMRDNRIKATATLSALADELGTEQIEAAADIMATATDRKATGLRLLHAGLTARQAGLLLTMKRDAVQKMADRARKSDSLTVC